MKPTLAADEMFPEGAGYMDMEELFTQGTTRIYVVHCAGTRKIGCENLSSTLDSEAVAGNLRGSDKYGAEKDAELCYLPYTLDGKLKGREISINLAGRTEGSQNGPIGSLDEGDIALLKPVVSKLVSFQMERQNFKSGGSSSILMDLASNEKHVHADFYNDFDDLFDDGDDDILNLTSDNA